MNDERNHETARLERDERREWATPTVNSTEVFTRAALECCLTGFPPEPQGSTGLNLPSC